MRGAAAKRGGSGGQATHVLPQAGLDATRTVIDGRAAKHLVHSQESQGPYPAARAKYRI